MHGCYVLCVGERTVDIESAASALFALYLGRWRAYAGILGNMLGIWMRSTHGTERKQAKPVAVKSVLAQNHAKSL
jgi:hypothetical protein